MASIVKKFRQLTGFNPSATAQVIHAIIWRDKNRSDIYPNITKLCLDIPIAYSYQTQAQTDILFMNIGLTRAVVRHFTNDLTKEEPHVLNKIYHVVIVLLAVHFQMYDGPYYSMNNATFIQIWETVALIKRELNDELFDHVGSTFRAWL